MTVAEYPSVNSEKQFDRSFIPDEEPLPIDSLGSGLKLSWRKTVELNHDFAQLILSLPEFCADRPLSNERVVYLHKAMERGTFRPEWVIIVTCSCDGKEYRMNGQHTCWARLEMDQKWRCPVQHYKYVASTEDDMRRLYSSIDRNFARTNGNVAVSYLFGTKEFEGFSKSTVRRLSEGLGFWLWDGASERNIHDADDRCYLLKTEHYQLATEVGRFIETCDRQSKCVLRRPVIAAIFATQNKAKAASSDFWSAVRDGIGFNDTDDPRLKLRNALMSASVAIGKGASPDKMKTVNAEEMYRWCIHAWNAYRTQQPVKILKSILDKPRPPVK